MTTAGNKKLILPLAALLILMVGGLGLYSFVNRITSQPITVEEIKVDSKAALKLGLLNQVSKKNGITEWELKAASATLFKERDEAVLEDVNVTFHTDKGTLVYLTSARGTLNTKSHDLIFEDNVTVRYEGYTLRSDKLQYDKKLHIIHTDSRVALEDGNSVIEGDAMVTDLNKAQIVLTGHVKGSFSENFDLL